MTGFEQTGLRLVTWGSTPTVASSTERTLWVECRRRWARPDVYDELTETPSCTDPQPVRLFDGVRQHFRVEADPPNAAYQRALRHRVDRRLPATVFLVISCSRMAARPEVANVSRQRLMRS